MTGSGRARSPTATRTSSLPSNKLWSSRSSARRRRRHPGAAVLRRRRRELLAWAWERAISRHRYRPSVQKAAQPRVGLQLGVGSPPSLRFRARSPRGSTRGLVAERDECLLHLPATLLHRESEAVYSAASNAPREEVSSVSPTADLTCGNTGCSEAPPAGLESAAKRLEGAWRRHVYCASDPPLRDVLTGCQRIFRRFREGVDWLDGCWACDCPATRCLFVPNGVRAGSGPAELAFGLSPLPRGLP